MAAYAALLSLAQTTVVSTKPDNSLFSTDAEEKVISIHDYANFLLLFFQQFPHKVMRWEGRIRDIAHEIEDIIEVFTWRRIQSRHSIMNPSRVKLEDQLENVMEKIGLIAGEVMEERPAYLPPSSSSSSSSRVSDTGNDAVVGLDDDIMTMKERLCGESSNLRVIPIVGMGGIGKSTLTRTLYEDQLIMEHFDIRAWVVVSQDYSPFRFKKTLLGSIKTLEEQMSGDVMDESDIELKVFQNLKGWRYLVVIDDVWCTQFWDDVKYMFPNDKNGSRIILTTRQLDVATYPSSAGVVHEMQFMNDSQSWDLLKLKVFTNSYCPSELEEVGKEIARRCAGLPLAVVLVAGVLSQENKNRASWEEIAENVNPAFGREIEEILCLSYTYLPHHLRPCFLFIGGFLEDVNISASRLVRLWVAEGFVKHKHGCTKSMEEEAYEYLEDLVKKNLVIATSRKSDGKIKSCSLHDMVRGLCIRKAREEKFFHGIDGPDLPQGLMNERRISFSHSDINTIWGPTFRTILCFQTQNFSSWLASIGSYKLLRVFDALGVDLKELPSEVFELYHLRYLALMGSFSIPSLVYNLVNLQTLIIHLASRKLWPRYGDGAPHSLPWEIWRMPQLRHLVFHAPCMLPLLLEGFNYFPLENLQTLLLVKDLVWNELIVQMIPHVKKLGLHYTTSQEYHLHHLKDLHHLVKLEVTGYLNFSWSIQIPSFPCTLKKLTLVGGGFPWKDMIVVGSLPHLEVLKLLHYACDGDTWVTSDEEFPHLKVLLIDESRLRQWITHSSSFPTLKHLVLRSCSYLREIPESLGKKSTVELIDVDHCRHSLVESAKKIKEEQESCGNYAFQVRTCYESHREQQVHSMDSPSESNGQEADSEAFQRLVVGRFQDMASSPSDELLSIPWIRKLLEAFLSIQEEFRVIVFNHRSNLNRAPMDRYFTDFCEQSVKALDICNAITDGIEQIHRWQKQLEIVLCALENQRSIGEGQFRRVKKALINLTIAMLDERESNTTVSHRNRSFGGQNNTQREPISLANFRSLSWSISRTWSTARQLQALSSNLPPPRANEISSTNGLIVCIFTMNYILLFVMWALVTAIPCQDRGLPAQFFMRQYSWAAPILSLYERIMEESKKRERRNLCGLMKEIHEIDKCVRLMNELTDCVQFPLTEEREREVKERVGEIGKVYEAIKEGLHPLERLIREVFRRIVLSRTESLDIIGRANAHD